MPLHARAVKALSASIITASARRLPEVITHRLPHALLAKYRRPRSTLIVAHRRLLFNWRAGHTARAVDLQKPNDNTRRRLLHFTAHDATYARQNIDAIPGLHLPLPQARHFEAISYMPEARPSPMRLFTFLLLLFLSFAPCNTRICRNVEHAHEDAMRKDLRR